jgi:hypothetical protein
MAATNMPKVTLTQARAVAIQNLAKLVSLPSDKRLNFTAKIADTLNIAWEYDNSKRLHREPGLRRDLKRIARCARGLGRLLDSPSAGVSLLLSASRPYDRGPTIADFNRTVGEFVQIADAAVELTATHASRGRGRRKGFRPNYEFKLFTNRLMTCVAECSGQQLTIHAKGRADTLLGALEILRPFLPQNFIPKTHLQMLPKIAKEWRVNSKKTVKKGI